ncbi:MAG: sensor histidine kinase [Myxococcota bacterium]
MDPGLAEAARGAPQAGAGARVLVVDDDAGSLSAVSAILEPLGVEVVRARSGEEALRACLRAEFAVIVLDVRMPGMDGFEVASLLRSRPRSAGTPIVFLTGAATSDLAAMRAYTTGAVDYMIKPAEPAVLRSKVAVFVDLWKRTEDLRVQEQALRHRTEELAERNEELEAFASAVSHDLRAPLRAIAGFGAILAQTAPDLPAEAVDALARIQSAVRRMSALIDDLLALSRVSRAEMLRVPFDLSRIAVEILEELALRDPNRRVEWTVEPGMRAEGDPGLVRLLLENLVGNAWKFTRDRDPARIEVCTELRDGHPSFAVRDNGVGFDMAFAGHLFRPFHRLHDPERWEGTGIGLATAERIARRHGGRVEGYAEPDRGATFRFTLG